jgi:hypothetical protein
MLDQAVAGIPFKLIGGWGWFPSPTGTEGTTNPAVLKPASVQAIFDAAFHGGATTQLDPLSKSNVKALRAFLRTYDVQTVIVSPSGKSPAAVIGYVTAAIGSPVMSGGQTAWFHVQQRLRVYQVHLAPAVGGNGAPFLNVVTHVITPTNGATVSGSRYLVATATSYFRTTKVDFYLTGGAQYDALIGTGRPTAYGWVTMWNTTTVSNGNYTLQSVASGAGGRSGVSASVPITVSN